MITPVEKFSKNPQGENAMLTTAHNDERHEDDHSDLRERAWREQAGAYTELLELFGDRKQVKLADANLSAEQKAAFEMALNVDVNEIVVECIDEGMPRIFSAEDNQKGVLQIGIGGAGILLKNDFHNFVEFLTDLYFQGKKIRVQSHENCGAADQASGKTGVKTVINRAAQDFGVELAAALSANINARKQTEAGEDVTISHSFVKAENMVRPEIHIATGATVDTTGRYNSTVSKGNVAAGLPSTFNLAGFYGIPDHVVANLEVAKGIALGGHGFADKFSKEQPFVIMLVMDSADDQSVKRAAELEEKIAKDPELQNPAIMVKVLNIVGFNQPAKAA